MQASRKMVKSFFHYLPFAAPRIVLGDGLAVVMDALRNPRAAASLQQRACEVLWRATGTSVEGARAAEAVGAVEALTSSMLRSAQEKCRLRQTKA